MDLQPGLPNPERQAVVGVIARDRHLLVIRRAAGIAAPGKLCLPGGRIEPGESQQQAVERELREELGVDANGIRLLFDSRSPWNVRLYWWLAEVPPNAEIRGNPLEVESHGWMTARQLLQSPDLLESCVPFLEALLSGAFADDLPVD